MKLEVNDFNPSSIDEIAIFATFACANYFAI